MDRESCAFRAVWPLVLVLSTSACAPAGLSQREEGLKLLLKRPIAGCSKVGAVHGKSGGFGGAWLDNETLKTYATSDAIKQAAALGATHVLLDAPAYETNSSGVVEGASFSGEAFVCRGQPQFEKASAVVPPVRSAQASAPARATGLRSIPQQMWRTWVGSAKQPGFGAFDVELSLSRSGASGTCGVSEYPSLGCRGRLVGCRAMADGTLEATQSLITPGKCSEGARLRMKLEGGALQASWSLPDGRAIARGELSGTIQAHPLLTSVRESLPLLPARAEPVLDEELFEVLPQFLPEVLPTGFVTEDPPQTQVGADSRFRVVRRYRRSDGSALVLTILLVRSSYEGASATLSVLTQTEDTNARLAGFPALVRPAPAGGRQIVFLVLSPRLQVELDATGIAVGALEGIVRGMSLGYLAQVEAQGRLAISAVSRAQEFEDEQGQKVTLATGRSAFADRVVSRTPGVRQGVQSDSNLALGPPDFTGKDGYYTLGCRGTVEVAFDDNVLVDGPGPDLHLFEVGRYVEAMKIRISTDGITWLDAGQVKGQPASLDIAGVAQKDAKYRYVELTDVGTECGNDRAGADIDAVGALNGQIAAPGTTPRRRSKPGPTASGGIDDPRKIAEAVQKNEGVPLDVAMTGQNWTLSERKGGYSVRSSGVARGDVNGDGRADAIVLSTRGDSRRTEHQLEIYTEREGGLGPLAQAVIGYGEPSPSAGSLSVSGNRIRFAMAGAPFSYELRHGSLIRLEP